MNDKERIAKLESALLAAGKYARCHTDYDGNRSEYDACPGDAKTCPRENEFKQKGGCPLGTPDIGQIDQCWCLYFGVSVSKPGGI